jgi:hypothetical protein
MLLGQSPMRLGSDTTINADFAIACKQRLRESKILAPQRSIFS